MLKYEMGRTGQGSLLVLFTLHLSCSIQTDATEGSLASNTKNLSVAEGFIADIAIALNGQRPGCYAFSSHNDIPIQRGACDPTTFASSTGLCFGLAEKRTVEERARMGAMGQQRYDVGGCCCNSNGIVICPSDVTFKQHSSSCDGGTFTNTEGSIIADVPHADCVSP